MQQPTPPIMIKIADPPSELGALGRVLVGSLGLTGTLLLIAILLAFVFAGVTFWIRSRSDTQHDGIT